MRNAAGRFLALVPLLAGILAASAGTAAPWLARDTGLAREAGLLKLGGHHVKWGAPRYGTPAAIRWAFVTEPYRDAAARNCQSMLPLEPLALAAGIDMARLELEIRAAFRVWSEVSALRFRRVDAMDKADILIGVQAGDDGVAFANVVEQAAPDGAIAPIARSAVCFDASERWELAADGEDRTYRLRYVAAHEIGHAVGLDHLGRKGGLIGFAYDPANENELGLSPADRAAIIRLYGPRQGPGLIEAGAAMPPTPCLVSAAGLSVQDCGGATPGPYRR